MGIAAVVPGFAELVRAPTFPIDWHDVAADLGPALGSVDFTFSFLVEVIFVSVLFVSAAEFLSSVEWSARLLACCSKSIPVNTSDVATDFGKANTQTSLRITNQLSVRTNKQPPSSGASHALKANLADAISCDLPIWKLVITGRFCFRINDNSALILDGSATISSHRRIMSSTTQKHADFVSQPMREKGVAVLPGIGPALKKEFEAAGFNKANNVLGKFLVLDKNEQQFKTWIKQTCPSANEKFAKDCYNGLKGWCNAHL